MSENERRQRIAKRTHFCVTPRPLGAALSVHAPRCGRPVRPGRRLPSVHRFIACTRTIQCPVLFSLDTFQLNRRNTPNMYTAALRRRITWVSENPQWFSKAARFQETTRMPSINCYLWCTKHSTPTTSWRQIVLLPCKIGQFSNQIGHPSMQLWRFSNDHVPQIDLLPHYTYRSFKKEYFLSKEIDCVNAACFKKGIWRCVFYNRSHCIAHSCVKARLY